MWDCHCHLADPGWDCHLEERLQEARQKGIFGWLSCAYDSASWARQAQVAKIPGVLVALGIHPWAAAEWNAQSSSLLRQSLKMSGAVAVGECGLDYHRARDAQSRQQQILALREQLSLALQLELPVVLHCVRAQEPLLQELDAAGPKLRAMLHGFLGTAQDAQAWLRRGVFLSLGPHAVSRTDLMKSLPLDRVLIETDAPSRGSSLTDLVAVSQAWNQHQPLQDNHFEANLCRFLGISQRETGRRPA